MKDKLRVSLMLATALMLVVGSLACGKRKETPAGASILTAEALYQAALDELASHDLRKARANLERIAIASDDLETLRPLVSLRLADATFYQGDDLALIEARSKYLDFVTLHGDHPLAPYAQFQAGVCALKQVEHPSRDQSQTILALAELKEVLRRYPASGYAIAAQGAIDQAESFLAEHEYMVGRFYLRRKSYVAASERFRRVLDKYPRYDGREKLYFYLGQALIRGEKDVEGKSYLDRLVDDYPNGEFASAARKLLARPAAEKKPDGEDQAVTLSTAGS